MHDLAAIERLGQATHVDRDIGGGIGQPGHRLSATGVLGLG